MKLLQTHLQIRQFALKSGLYCIEIWNFYILFILPGAARFADESLRIISPLLGQSILDPGNFPSYFLSPIHR